MIKTQEKILRETIEGMDAEVIKSAYLRNGLDRIEKQEQREEYVRQNAMKWLEEGERLRKRREEHRISIRQVSELLGTSATRVGNLERGEPITMAKHLIECYDLLFDHLELKAAVLRLSEINEMGMIK